MKNILDPAIVNDREGGGNVVWGGDGADPDFYCFLDPSNVARRGSPSVVVGDEVGSCLCLLDDRESPPNKGGRFCNLSECRRAGGVTMVATWSGSNAKAL